MEILTDENFSQKVESSQGIVAIDFFASWCGPCRSYTPIFEEVAKSLDKGSFYKVDVDQAQQVAQKYGVRSIPTTIFFKDGEKVDAAVGLLQKSQLQQKIAELSE